MRIAQILHGLTSSPRFSLSVVATLGLGLAVSLLMAVLLWQAVLQPLPFAKSSQLAVIQPARDGQDASLSPAEAAELPGLLPQGYAMTSFTWDGTTYIGGERPESVTTLAVASNFFEVLGVAPFMGRALQEGDDLTRSVVLTESSWRKHFNADPNILGRVFKEDVGESVIVGVAPESLEYMASGLAYFHVINWAPMKARAAPYVWARYFAGILRAPTGASLESNQVLMQAHDQLGEKYGGAVADWQLSTTSFEHSIRGDVRAPMLTLASLSLLVLMIAGVNAAHMVMTRGRKRALAFAVMDALGASRWQMAKIVLAETAILALLATGVAIFLSWLVLTLSPNFAQAGLPFDAELSGSVVLSAGAIGGAFGLGGLALLLTGLYPALKIARHGAQASLRPAHLGRWSKYWLGVPGIALSIAALCCAVLFFRSVQALRDQPLGLNVDGAVTAQIFMRAADTGPNQALWAARAQELLEIAKKIPGASSVAISNGVPFNPVGTLNVSLDDGPALQTAAGKTALQVVVRSVLGDPIDALGYTLRSGRVLNASDHADAAKVLLVNQRFAKQYFGDVDPLGRTVMLPPMGEGKMQAFTVVGVIGDARFQNPTTAAEPEAWVPFAQYPSGALALIVRGAPNGLKAVQEAVWQQDPSQAIFRAYDLRESLEELSAAPRFFAKFAGLFAWLALILAALGTYAILAFDIAERTREFALRAALGAKPRALLAAVVWESQRLLIPGLVLGVAGAWALGSVLRAQIYGETTMFLPLLLASSTVVGLTLIVSTWAGRATGKVSLNEAIKG